MIYIFDLKSWFRLESNQILDIENRYKGEKSCRIFNDKSLYVLYAKCMPP